MQSHQWVRYHQRNIQEIQDFYVFLDNSDTLILYFLSQGESYSIGATAKGDLS